MGKNFHRDRYVSFLYDFLLKSEEHIPVESTLGAAIALLQETIEHTEGYSPTWEEDRICLQCEAKFYS